MRRFALLGIVVTGCVPHLVGGTIRANDCDAKSPRAVPGGTVRVECPRGDAGAEKFVALELTADANGRFRQDKTPELPASCEVVVSGPGLRDRRYAIEDYCMERYDRSECSAVWLDATLLAAHGADAGAQ